jgi:hypothetical protein
LIVCNENQVKEAHMDELKPNITDTPIDLRRKYKDSTLIDNYMHWVFLTNRRAPFEEFNRKQRRFAVIQCCARYAGKEHKTYWDQFRGSLTQETADHFATFLLSRDLNDKDVRNWPESQYWNDMVSEMTHPVEKYLLGQDFVLDFPNKSAMARELLSKINVWLQKKYDEGESDRCSTNQMELASLIVKTGKFDKKKKNDGTLYIRKQ